MAARNSYDDVPPDNIIVIPNAAPLIATTTDCYVGVNAGYGWGHDEVSSGGTNEGDPNFRGGLGGGQIGCDYQFATSWVIGVEAIYDLNLSRHL
jgi:outer membrane immunogenic protein